MLREYKDKTAVVTGAAEGLGRALATDLAKRGCHLLLIDLKADGLARVREEGLRFGVRVTTFVADVGSQDQMQKCASAEPVHLLINNAGVSASTTFLNTSVLEFDRIMRINFFGTVNGCRALLPLLKQSQGQILNVSSCFAWVGCPGKTAYAASKGAIRSFSESLRLELARAGVGVTVLYPGPLATNLLGSGSAESQEQLQREEQFLKQRAVPLDRVAGRCLDRLKNNPSRIVIGSDYHALSLLSRLSPALAEKTIAWGSACLGF